MNEFKNVAGINFLKLHGSNIERAAMHGKYLKDSIKNGALETLANRNQQLLRHAGGILGNKFVQDLAVNAYNKLLIPRLKSQMYLQLLALHY